MALNHEALKARRAGNSSGRGWKPKDGVNRVRILPPHSQYLGRLEELRDLSLSYKLHYFHIEGRPTEVSLCLDQLTPKQRCPACETWRKYRKHDDPGMAALAKDIGPSDAYLFNILDHNALDKGVQWWAANYTCWDKIMEIAGNPAWGDVVDPATGLDFDVTLTPASKSRTKNNSYSVMPNPERTDVSGLLEGLENWPDPLDHLGEQITAAKTAEEIQSLLNDIGFPLVAAKAPVGTPVAVRPPAPAADPAPAAPRPVAAAPRPVAVPARPAAAPAAAPKPAAPVAAKPVAITPRKAAAPAPVAEEAAVHYDPGADFEEVTPEDERPAGAPRCFGDYKPQVHDCQPCPMMADCQMKLLGIN